MNRVKSFIILLAFLVSFSFIAKQSTKPVLREFNTLIYLSDQDTNTTIVEYLVKHKDSIFRARINVNTEVFPITGCNSETIAFMDTSVLRYGRNSGSLVMDTFIVTKNQIVSLDNFVIYNINAPHVSELHPPNYNINMRMTNIIYMVDSNSSDSGLIIRYKHHIFLSSHEDYYFTFIKDFWITEITYPSYVLGEPDIIFKLTCFLTK